MKLTPRLALPVLLALALLAPHRSDAADTLGKTSVRTATIGDVTIEIAGSDGSSVAQIAATNSVAAGNGLHILGGRYDSSLPTNTSGRSVALQTDVNGRLIITQDASAGALGVNLTKVGGSTLSASNPVIAQLSDGSSAYTGAKTGQLPSSLGQTTKSGSVSVAIASDNTVSVSQGAPTGAATIRAAPVNIASAGTTTITCKGSLTASTPLKLYRVRATGAAMARCTARYNDNGSSTNYGDLMLSAAKPSDEIAFPAGFAGQTTGSTGTQAIELSCTNFDSAAQDIGCDVSYCIAASGC